MSDEHITAPTASEYSLNPELSSFGTKTILEFKESCLKWNSKEVAWSKLHMIMEGL